MQKFVLNFVLLFFIIQFVCAQPPKFEQEPKAKKDVQAPAESSDPSEKTREDDDAVKKLINFMNRKFSIKEVKASPSKAKDECTLPGGQRSKPRRVYQPPVLSNDEAFLKNLEETPSKGSPSQANLLRNRSKNSGGSSPNSQKGMNLEADDDIMGVRKARKPNFGNPGNVGSPSKSKLASPGSRSSPFRDIDYEGNRTKSKAQKGKDSPRRKGMEAKERMMMQQLVVEAGEDVNEESSDSA